MIGQGCCQWLSLLTTMPRMPALVTPRLNSITARVSFKEDVDLHSRFYSANKLAEELRELIEICCQNLLHT